jgi:hypothetical protein
MANMPGYKPPAYHVIKPTLIEQQIPTMSLLHFRRIAKAVTAQPHGCLPPSVMRQQDLR